MRVKGLLLILSCGAGLALPAGAQVESTAEPARKDARLPAALQKKVAAGTVALRANTAAPVGPLFDRASKNWTIETADCPLVQSQVKGSGVKGHTVWAAANDDGSFHIQLRTEASGTAVDAGGNNYIWIYSELAELDTPDPTIDALIVTGYASGTFQLIPLASTGSGYTVAEYVKVDTPTPINSVGAPVANAPLGCKPI